MHGEFRCHACGTPATHEVLRFTRLGELAWKLAEVQFCLEGAGVAVGGSIGGFQMLQPPPSTRLPDSENRCDGAQRVQCKNPRLEEALIQIFIINTK